MTINFPTDQQHLSIIGRNGSGKTVAAIWHLSERDYHIKPWIVYDFKGDENITRIEGAEPIALTELPIYPGVYVAHPEPDDTDLVEAQMRAIWKRENTGVYIDEGHMIDRNNSAFRALLTQGRSKHVPLIVLSQRPAWVDKFVFTESTYFQIFDLQHADDKKRVLDFVPVRKTDLDFDKLPEYHSYYYDVKRKQLTTLAPVPPIETILRTFDRRLRHRRKPI